MTLLLDASAVLAIIFEEPEAPDLLTALGREPSRITSGVALWETARAIAKRSRGTMAEGHAEAARFCTDFAIRVVPIGALEAEQAALAFDRFGKGRHPARLNMGDCFAYACAKTSDARLLYEGEDFVHTDLA